MLTPDPDDKDEIFVYDERLAILLAGADREPTAGEVEMAAGDVVRFRRERVD